MRIGLLLCDRLAGRYVSAFGAYSSMFRRLLAEGDGVEMVTFDLPAGEFPVDLGECDGWVCTGSRRSVYEDEGWIDRLADLVRTAADGGHRFVGICFGHQMVGHALGGKVSLSARGWGVGVKEVEVLARAPWMQPAADSFRVLNMHQDQIDVPPPGSTVLGSNEHCPVSMLSVGKNILGLQGHPEFDVEFNRRLMEDRRGGRIPAAVVDAGLASLSEPVDRELLAGWILRFLRGDDR